MIDRFFKKPSNLFTIFSSNNSKDLSTNILSLFILVQLLNCVIIHLIKFSSDKNIFLSLLSFY